MEISIQLYSIHQEMNRDYRNSMKRVGEIGFQGIEFAGYGGLSAEEMKTLLADSNLYSVGAHVGLAVMEEDLEAELQYHEEVGTKYLICPSATLNTMEDVDHLVNVLNKASVLAAEKGMKIGYHNHDFEFQMIEGKYILDWIGEKTNENVILELDVYWVAYAGVDPIAYINKWGKKVELIHLKQINDKKENVDMQDGILDMTAIKEVATHAKYFVLEHEDYDKPIWDSIQNDFDHLRSI